MLCFSIAIDKCNSENASYERVESKWKPELKEHAKNVPIILVGLKEDLRHQKNMTAVTVEQVSADKYKVTKMLSILRLSFGINNLYITATEQ